MAKIFVVLLVGLGVALYFPRSRQYIYEKSMPVLNPALRWQTKDEMDQIVRDLRTYEQEHYDQLPDQREWPAWLAHNYQGGEATDAWGSQYHFMIQRDSFLIISYGPDKVYGTDDDIRSGGVRASSR